MFYHWDRDKTLFLAFLLIVATLCVGLLVGLCILVASMTTVDDNVVAALGQAKRNPWATPSGLGVAGGFMFRRWRRRRRRGPSR